MRHILKRGVFLCLLGAFSPVGAGDKLELPNDWQVQPATTVKKQPVSQDWGKWGLRNWRWSGKPKGLSWSKIKTGNINSIWLKNTFKIPADWSGSKVLLNFMRLEGDSIVFVNGVKIGERLRPYGTIDITKGVKPGQENVLTMFVTRDYTDISRDFKQDPLRYTARKNMKMDRFGLGVTAPVYLERIPRPAGIAGTFVKTSWRKKTITLETDIDAAAKQTGLTIEADIYDAAGKKVLQFSKNDLNVPTGESVCSVSSSWKNPIPWELDGAYLYTAKLTLKKGSETLDTYQTKFGFREVWTEGRDLYMNGHKSRWRIEWSSFGITENSIPFLKMVGRNTIYYQPNPTSWWKDWAEVPYFPTEQVEMFDREGIAVLMPAPGVCSFRSEILKDQKLVDDYTRETRDFIKHYRNHPSVIAWSVGMNSFNPRDAIHPDTMGQRSDYTHSQAKAINKALDIVKAVDPTRLGYSHADGNLGDVATANCYPNFAPVQEYEDWPSIWAEKGNMPWFACEFASFYNGSLYKGKQLLLTEYASIYFGEDAYNKESDEQLKRTLDISVKHRSHGNNIYQMIPYAPIFWDLDRIFTVNTDRAWRTWGVQGWHYFNFGVGYGNPPEFKGKRPFNRYDCLKKKVTKVPDWVNEFFYSYRKNMQQLLAYIAGAPVHTDKTHAFFAGEKAVKQIAIVWDGPGDKTVTAVWMLKDAAGKAVYSGKEREQLKAGDIKFIPIKFTAPGVKQRSEYKLEMSLMENGKTVASDSFPLQVFPAMNDKLSLKKRVVMFDPENRSSWVGKLTDTTVYKTGMKLKANDILVIGREALKKGDALPYTAKDIANGLKVVILEQNPLIWEGLGFQSIETAARYTFAADKQSVLLKGLQPEDLIHWRGTPDIIPEFKAARGYDVIHAPKVTNRNTVASCLLKVPQVVGFTPVLIGEFALDFTPLLTWKYGKGMVIYSSLDLTGRVESSPAAAILARNILTASDNTDIDTKNTYYTGTAKGTQELKILEAGITPGLSLSKPSDTILVEYGKSGPDTDRFVKDGGTVISIDLSAQELASLGFKTEKKKLYKATSPGPEAIFRGITRNLLRWRDALEVTAFKAEQKSGCKVYSDGIFMVEKSGKGQRLFVQVAPEMLRDRYKQSSDKREAMLLSVSALNQLVSKILTNAGCESSEAVAARVTDLKAGPSYKNLGFWQVIGPFYVKGNYKVALDTVFSPEKNAIAGDTNPNFMYKREGMPAIDFRGTATANADGFIDLGKALKANKEGSVGYAVKLIDCKKAGPALLRLGVDYFMKVWINGKLVYDLRQGHSSPKPNRHIVKADFKQGENVITLKIYSGSKGFGFWANMSEPGSAATEGTQKKDIEAELYDPTVKLRDPYEYHYW